MPRATYKLELMLDYNAWTDVTADWQTAEPLVVERGAEPGERVAGVGRMRFALYNPDGRYTPGHPGALPGIDAGVRVRFSASDGVSARALFTGRVDEVTLCAGAEGERVALSCVDDIAALRRAPVGACPLALDAAPGDLVERLVARAVVPVGRLACWRLDHPQAGRLGALSALSDRATGMDLDAGQSRFPWAGDTWPAHRSTLAAIEDVCASEGGWFCVAADGTPAFRDRHARPRHTLPDAALSAGLEGLAIRRDAGRLVNRVEATTHPREVGAAGEVLWQAGHSVRIAPGETRVLVCPYSDPGERVADVGALSVETPLPGADFTASDALDGAGQDLTGTVRVALEAGAAAARLTLRSDWTGGVVYVHGLRLRGVPLRRYIPATVAVEDAASVLARGPHPLRVDLPLQDDTRAGEDMSRALLANRAQPHAWPVVEIEATASAEALAQALARDVGDRLSLTSADLGLDGARCFVERVRHEVRRGGASHRVTWWASPADLEAYWVLGAATSALGEASRLGY